MGLVGSALKDLRSLITRRDARVPTGEVREGMSFARLQRLIVAQTFAVLAETGVFVQFTYGPAAPVTRSIAEDVGIVGTRSSWILENFPPAFVWTYRRREDLAGLERSA